MNFTNGYQAGRFVGEHYLDYLIGFQMGFWMGVPLAMMKQIYSQPRQLNQSGNVNERARIAQSVSSR
jgi:hypothetical protein